MLPTWKHHNANYENQSLAMIVAWKDFIGNECQDYESCKTKLQQKLYYHLTRDD